MKSTHSRSDDDTTEDEAYVDSNNNNKQANPISLDLNNHLDLEEEAIPSEMVSSIGTHRYKDGIVQIRVTYQDGVTTWMDVDDLKSVYPNILAHYVLKYDMGEIVNGKYRRWTTSFLRSLQVVEQRQRRTQISGF